MGEKHCCNRDTAVVLTFLAGGRVEDEHVKAALQRLRRRAAHCCGSEDVTVDPNDPSRVVARSRVCDPYPADIDHGPAIAELQSRLAALEAKRPSESPK